MTEIDCELHRTCFLNSNLALSNMLPSLMLYVFAVLLSIVRVANHSSYAVLSTIFKTFVSKLLFCGPHARLSLGGAIRFTLSQSSPAPHGVLSGPINTEFHTICVFGTYVATPCLASNLIANIKAPAVTLRMIFAGKTLPHWTDCWPGIKTNTSTLRGM